MKSKKGLWGGVALALLVLAVAAAGRVAQQARHDQLWRADVAAGLRAFQPAAVSPLMELPGELRESSGVVASSRNPGVLWTHNDSGHRPVLYGIQPDSRFGDGIVARLRLRGASAVDWEDIALGPCPWDAPIPCLYVADTGDNFARRSSVTVIVFEEPSLDETGGDGFEVKWSAAVARYPDGPVDAEGIAVSEAGDLMVVTKAKGNRARVFLLSRDEVAVALKEGPATMRLVGFVETRWPPGVTAAAWTGNGELAVRTLVEVSFWRRGDGGWTQTRPPCYVGHAGRGGEGLDVPRPGVLYLTREASGGRPAGVDLAVCAG